MTDLHQEDTTHVGGPTDGEDGFCHIADGSGATFFCGIMIPLTDSLGCRPYDGEGVCPTCGQAICPTCATVADLNARVEDD